MITDDLSHASLYAAFGPSWEKAFGFLEKCKQNLPEAGRYEIDGDNVYAIVQKYETSEPENVRWEAHKEYIDIQCVLTGRELIGFAPADRGHDPTDYDPVKDCYFFGCVRHNMMVSLEKEQFAVFMPEEIHQPHVIFCEKCTVNKVVVKIRKNLV